MYSTLSAEDALNRCAVRQTRPPPDTPRGSLTQRAVVGRCKSTAPASVVRGKRTGQRIRGMPCAVCAVELLCHDATRRAAESSAPMTRCGAPRAARPLCNRAGRDPKAGVDPDVVCARASASSGRVPGTACRRPHRRERGGEEPASSRHGRKGRRPRCRASVADERSSARRAMDADPDVQALRICASPSRSLPSGI